MAHYENRPALVEAVGRLNHLQLRDVLAAYDEYIQAANDDDRFAEGWRPVCVAEFVTSGELMAWIEAHYEPNPPDDAPVNVRFASIMRGNQDYYWPGFAGRKQPPAG
jgi:hypothetical protein